MDKIIDKLDEKVWKINTIYFSRFARDYIVKNIGEHMGLHLLAELMQIPDVDEFSKILEEQATALNRIFEYLNGDIHLKQDEDISYSNKISSYDSCTFHKFMTGKQKDFKDCLEIICKVRKDDRLYPNENKRKVFDSKNILTWFSIYFCMVGENAHKGSIESASKLSSHQSFLYTNDFDMLLKKYRMKVLQCIHSVAGSVGRMNDFIYKVAHYSKYKEEKFKKHINDFLEIKQIIDKEEEKAENRRIIDATRPTQREQVLAEKFERWLSLRPIRDSSQWKGIISTCYSF